MHSKSHIKLAPDFGALSALMKRLGAFAICILVLLGLSAVASADQAPPKLDECNVVFDSPSTNASGAVPLGNGKLGVSAWIEPSGDLVMYLSSPDSFSGTPNLLKLGKLRVSFSPTPSTNGATFVQTLKLREGRLEAQMGDAHLEVFVEPEQPIVRVSVTSKTALSFRVTNEVWRTQATKAGGWGGMGWDETADTILGDDIGTSAIASYHRNEKSVVPDMLKHQSCDQLAGTYDPLLNRSFGLWVEGAGLQRRNPTVLESQPPAKTLDLRIACPMMIAEKPESWINAARAATAAAPSLDKARAQTEASWNAFWARSWVLPGMSHVVNGKPVSVAQAYALTRYTIACQGKGEFPIKFNGGIFTVESQLTDSRKIHTPDFREWGDAYWFQNTRHMYHPLLMSGDFDLMQPFFNFYNRARPLAESRAKSWFNADGANFPETMTLFGTYAYGDYGVDRRNKQPGDIETPWVGRIWNQGLETVSLMLDYWDWTQDSAFARDQLVPMSTSVLRYFESRFRHGSQLVVSPTQVVETYRNGVTNDIVNVAGLRAICARLELLPDSVAPAQMHAYFAKMKQLCPPLPTMDVTKNGNTTHVLAPAETFDRQRFNTENPVLYAIWPFQLFGIGKPDLELARATYAARPERLDVGWGYDGNAAALLGLAEEAKRIMLVKCANSHPAHRFPATWGPNYDWLPDMNHGGNLMETLELMLVQSNGKAIHLLPAWPRDWDCQFKLHAALNTVIEGEVKAGKVVNLKVTPLSRAQDVVNCWEK